MTVAVETAAVDIPPPRARPWTRERIIGHVLLGLWVLAGLCLVFYLVTAWNPELAQRWALPYLSGLGVNSMYFLTMNNHGDGQKAWPWTGPDSYYNYDCSKLDQWDVVFAHMDAVGIMMHVVLSEYEIQSYFEVAELGAAGGFAPSRKIYYRELIARFGYHLAITWNVGEENGMDGTGYGVGQTTQQRKDTAAYLRQLAYYADHITVHNGPSTDRRVARSLTRRRSNLPLERRIRRIVESDRG